MYGKNADSYSSDNMPPPGVPQSAQTSAQQWAVALDDKEGYRTCECCLCTAGSRHVRYLFGSRYVYYLFCWKPLYTSITCSWCLGQRGPLGHRRAGHSLASLLSHPSILSL